MSTLREQLDYARQSRDEWKGKWETCAETVAELKAQVASLKESLYAARKELHEYDREREARDAA